MFDNVYERTLVIALLQKMMEGDGLSTETKQMMWADARDQLRALDQVSKWIPF